MSDKLKNVNLNDKPADKKIKKDALFAVVSKLINRTHPPLMEQVWPVPDFKIHIVRDYTGQRSFITEHNNKEMNYVDFEFVVDKVLQFVVLKCGSRLLRGTSFLEKDARDLAKYWRSTTVDFPHKINPIAELSDDSYTFRKLDFDFSTPGSFEKDCPAFFELMSRTSNSKALMTWIGSLFSAGSDRQQYVWIYGDGQNGKGSLARVLGNIFGPTCAWEQVPTENERRFWTSGILGKRLVIFDDCSNYGFTGTGFFKSLTGGSSVRIEQKNQTPFSAELATKFLFLSNERPALEAKKADLRRVIFCHAEPPTTDFGPHYERDYLARESALFLGLCKKLYIDEVINKGLTQILTETEEIESIIDDGEDYYRSIIEKHFQIELMAIANDCVSAGEFVQILRSDKITSQYEIRKIKQYLERQGVKRKQTSGHHRIKYYDGLVKI